MLPTEAFCPVFLFEISNRAIFYACSFLPEKCRENPLETQLNLNNVM
jgi:hypothetical protein